MNIGTASQQPAPPTADDEAAPLFEALAAAARDCAREIGLPVALEDEGVHYVLKAAGYNLTTASRQRLGEAVGLHAFPVGQWSYHVRDPRVFCTAPVDPRPRSAWDDCLWIAPHTLLTRANEKDSVR